MDDRLYLRTASYLAQGRWLGPFDQFTLLKGPAYPAFVAAMYRSGVPLKVGDNSRSFSGRGRMGFGFPKEEREALVASDPKNGGGAREFLMPEPSDLRYHWVRVRLAALDVTEMRELVFDAWRMCVPKRVAADYERDRGNRR